MALYPASCMRLAEGEEATEEGILEPFLRQERTRHQLPWESWTRFLAHRMSIRAISPGEEGGEGSRSAAG
eukprot:3941532-Pleurochrysis_carterae.AAC.1